MASEGANRSGEHPQCAQSVVKRIDGMAGRQRQGAGRRRSEAAGESRARVTPTRPEEDDDFSKAAGFYFGKKRNERGSLQCGPPRYITAWGLFEIR